MSTVCDKCECNPCVCDEIMNNPGLSKEDWVCEYLAAMLNWGHCRKQLASLTADRDELRGKLDKAEECLQRVRDYPEKYISDTEIAPDSQFKTGAITALRAAACVADTYFDAKDIDKYKLEVKING